MPPPEMTLSGSKPNCADAITAMERMAEVSSAFFMRVFYLTSDLRPLTVLPRSRSRHRRRRLVFDRAEAIRVAGQRDVVGERRVAVGARVGIGTAIAI